MINQLGPLLFRGKTSRLATLILLSTIATQEASAKLTLPYNLVVTQQNVTGRVTANQESVAGVTLTVKERPTVSVSTDNQGNFSIQASIGQTLVVSAIGYNSQEIIISSLVNNIDIMASNQALEEVVVVGFGTQKKANLTGSVASLDLSTVQNRVQPNLASAIQGTTPGVTVISRPGQAAAINVRGRGNLGSSAPLYVIDGAISDGTVFSNLDPNNIKSVSFLKDAASSAIYGSRAAYGVILVTTKKGTEGTMAINYSGYMGYRSPTYLPKVVNSTQYAELMNEALFNRNPKLGMNQAYTPEEVEKFSNGSDPDRYPNTNWFDLALDKNVPTTNHSLNFSGGSSKINYFTALGYNQDQAFTPGSESKKYNFQTNLSSDVTDWLTIKGNIAIFATRAM
ncbi:TonB-dependent receptor plug domain-containing protein [Sphingobacterium sp. ML3W]|uniref:TonB-dependent receptor plug domain-containing protein n=1 Tax=Sphingobacterium sp. ML3W TaxID=1538644 RepID=UPI00068B2231|nr:TonB-dependent receptor plug domain-containing protein [Sphingobacterium sp. ML3W]